MPAIAAKVDPGLVDINTQLTYEGAEGAGTGIVLTSTGEVLTNNHVIANSTKLTATDIGNGKTYNTEVLGYDSAHDIALIQLQGASGLRTATIADSSKAAVGDPVVAIGNAGGAGGTPSQAGGSITALGQSIAASDDLDGSSEQLTNLIQTNADVQPGDSGGSLVNTDGQVIGIDTAASQGFDFQSSQNQGFAIPINQALATVRQIRAGHEMRDRPHRRHRVHRRRHQLDRHRPGRLRGPGLRLSFEPVGGGHQRGVRGHRGRAGRAVAGRRHHVAQRPDGRLAGHPRPPHAQPPPR